MSSKNTIVEMYASDTHKELIKCGLKQPEMMETTKAIDSQLTQLIDLSKEVEKMQKNKQKNISESLQLIIKMYTITKQLIELHTEDHYRNQISKCKEPFLKNAMNARNITKKTVDEQIKVLETLKSVLDQKLDSSKNTKVESTLDGDKKNKKNVLSIQKKNDISKART